MTLEQQLRAFARNRTAVVGSGAGVVLVYLAWRQLRAQQAPIIVPAAAAAPAVDTGAVSLAAFQAGAAAAGSGLDAGAALGQSALGLAGSAVTDLGTAVGTLAQSQSDMGATLSGSLSQAIGVLTAPAQSPAPAPLPEPLPGSTPTPSQAPAPAPAVYRVSSTGSTVYASASMASRQLGTLRTSATATRSLVGGVWWYRLSSAYPGGWVHADGRLTATRA